MKSAPTSRVQAFGDSSHSQPRILFLGKRFYTNKDALVERFGRIYQLPSLWAAQGSRVLLWLVDYHGKSNATDERGSLRIISTPVISFSVLKALLVVFRFRPGVVVTSGDSYIGLAGWLLARLTGAIFVFDIYDKYDEFTGYKKLFGFDTFSFLRKRADLKFFCSRSLAEFYSREEMSGPSDIVVNGVDDAIFAPMDKQECRRLLGLAPADVLVGYFGSMEMDRGVSDLLRAIETLRDQGNDIRLLICGKENPLISLDQDWVIFRGMVAHSDMPYYLNASDVLAIPYRESAIMDMGASCKIAEYLMCERPVVSTSTANFVGNFPLQARELGAGMSPPGDVHALALAIKYQLVEQRVLTRPSDRGWNKIAAAALSTIRSRLDGPT